MGVFTLALAVALLPSRFRSVLSAADAGPVPLKSDGRAALNSVE
jgi:hypothetical protein